MTSREAPGEHEDGFSLIELIVAILVASILLSAVATIFFNSWRTQEEVGSVTDGTNHGQIVGSMIERAVRNAENLTVTANELKVWTSFDGTTLECQGFRISSGTMEVATSTSTLPVAWPQWSPALVIGGTTPHFSRSTEDIVSYAFDIDTEGATVRISGESQPRSVLQSGNGGCW